LSYKTEQEDFWAKDFGNEYINRNQNITEGIRELNDVVRRTSNVKSVIEFGCNIGLKLKALNILLPECKLTGVEINESACKILNEWGKCNVINQSIFDYNENQKYDLSMTNGVLIHINPTMLNNVYEKLYNSSNRYILVHEYYNPTPVSVDYRGHSNKLFKRDFAGEMLDKYSDLTLVDYGFNYHRDNNFDFGDATWFLLEKN